MGLEGHFFGEIVMRSIIFLLIGLAAGILIGTGGAPWTPAGANPGARAKVGEFSTVKIDQQGAIPALDFHLNGKARAIRFFTPEQKEPRAYFNESGQFYTNGWVTISGTMSGKGDGYNIVPPSLIDGRQDPFMLAVWSDVIGPALEVRTANTDDPGSYVFQAMGRNAEYTFSIEQNGGLRWGAKKRADMDTNLYRGAAKTLKTDGSLVVGQRLAIGTAGPPSTLHVGGSQSVHRTAAAGDYTATDHDYYIGVTNTAAPRRIQLPPASGRAGRVYVIKDESGGAAAHPISVRANDGEKIDGAATLTIHTNHGVLRVISTGAGWFSM
jgi:hypothetical protein